MAKNKPNDDDLKKGKATSSGRKLKPQSQLKSDETGVTPTLNPIYPMGSDIPHPATNLRRSANGLSRFSFSAEDNPNLSRGMIAPMGFDFAYKGAQQSRSAIEEATIPTSDRPAIDLRAMSTENAARTYLRSALASAELPTFTSSEVNGQQSEFKSLGTEKLPLCDTQAVKFRQTYFKVPVYGSLITVELDDQNQLVSINSSMGDPQNVNPVATLSPADAVSKVALLAGYTTGALQAMPQLHYYYDSLASRWRLVYVIEDVLKQTSSAAPPLKASSILDHEHESLPPVVDFIIDAHNGELVKEVPRTPTATTLATDALGKQRTIGISTNAAVPNNMELIDADLNIRTCDFAFKSIRFNTNSLPGVVIANPPAPFDSGAVSAHANAAVVAQFLRNVLRRNNVDNMGGEIICSVNCIDALRPDRVWKNAAWYRNQMVYGQQKVNGALRSFSVGLDVVAHEIWHGVTEKTARLEYDSETGALNESYSDIFGAIVSNFETASIANWNWEMGEDLAGTGVPLRDVSNPARFRQPIHMNGFLVAQPPYNQSNDFGHVHTNSGIHNFAAYKIMTAKVDGEYLFTPTHLAVIFYIALTQHLSRRSTFSDSRNGVTLAARSLFRNDTPAARQVKLQAIAQAFDVVGISLP